MHTKNGRNKRKDRGSPTSRSLELKISKNFKKDYSSYKCYTCHKLRHISRNCLLNKKFKKKNGMFHGHAAKENESDEERIRENEESNEEYVLISSLTG